jgi:hypothetical protein
MTIKTPQVTVTTTPVLLSQADTDKQYEGGYLQTVTITASAAIRVGGADISTTSFPIAAGVPASFDLGPSDALWARTDSGTATVNLFVTGV